MVADAVTKSKSDTILSTLAASLYIQLVPETFDQAMKSCGELVRIQWKMLTQDLARMAYKMLEWPTSY